ncbi:unnamed protein product [Heligmosomoides polygyrus]|uniref:Uncharacterized protein n=1 Tax=Heligmosomoides polygyrus TaxID=6339 RepID=A0A183FMQ3_HELPZ|nr:unnamed protein product [Heligmosomoides polygyrus]
MAPGTCEESMTPCTSESSAACDDEPVAETKDDAPEKIETPRDLPKSNESDVSTEAVDTPSPLRILPRSISECEGNDDRDSQRSILRNPNLAKIRPMMEKRQSFDLRPDDRQTADVSNEQDVIERYYQRNQATINSRSSKSLYGDCTPCTKGRISASGVACLEAKQPVRSGDAIA